MKKTDFSFLPPHKQAEIKEATAAIREAVPAEMIILFGSYARNDYVEEKYDAEHYKYQSDIDVLVIVETKSITTQIKYETAIEDKIDTIETIKTPVCAIVHDIDFINCRLQKAQYFFSEIQKQGVVLYNSKKFQLSNPRKLIPQERKKLAQDDFNFNFKEAKEFQVGWEFYITQGLFNKAAFLLHQTTEKLYSAILLVFTRYKPNTHDLLVLRKIANSLDNRLVKIFPLQGTENRRLFKLFRKAYVDSRYDPNYTITAEELTQLVQKVNELKAMTELLCKEKINSFDQ